MSAQDALERAYNVFTNSAEFTFSLQFYGDELGYLVVMVNETYDSFISAAQPFFYWEFLVNGTPARKGIDHTILKAGDHVLFSFETYNPVKHAKSTLRAKFEHQTQQARGPSA